jgi:hypothetical protein
MATFLPVILRLIYALPQLDERLFAHFAAIAEEPHFTSKIGETAYTPALSDTTWCSSRSEPLSRSNSSSHRSISFIDESRSSTANLMTQPLAVTSGVPSCVATGPRSPPGHGLDRRLRDVAGCARSCQMSLRTRSSILSP